MTELQGWIVIGLLVLITLGIVGIGAEIEALPWLWRTYNPSPSRGAADRGEYCEVAGASAEGPMTLFSCCGFVGSIALEKHELSKIEFEIIEDAFKALLQSRADPVTADKVADLRDKFRDAFTGWLEIEKEAA